MSMYLKFRIGKDKRKLVPINGFELKDADSNNPQWLQGRQNEDGGRQVFVDLEDENGSPVNLTGASAVFKGVLPGGQYKIWDHKSSTIIDAQAGRFRYTFPKRAMAIAGSYKQAFFEIFREGTKLATLEFNFEVLADLVEENIIPSDYITPFEDLYGKLKDYIVKANGDFETAMAQWKKDVAELITELNADISGINLTITEIKSQLSALEDKIKADGLLTLADFEKLIQPILDDLNAPIIVDEDIDIGGRLDPKIKKQLDDYIAGLPEGFKIGIISDAHFEDHYDNSYFGSHPYTQDAYQHLTAFNYLADHVDVLIANGDNTNGNNPLVDHTIAEGYDYADKILMQNSSADKFVLLGNHDDNTAFKYSQYYNNKKILPHYSNMIISEDEFKQMFRTSELINDEVRNGDSLYFYKDYEDAKVRLIGLNSEDIPEDAKNTDGSLKYDRYWYLTYSQAQLNWVAKTALMNVPEGYKVIVVSHVPINGKEERQYNQDLMIGVLNAFATGNSFSGSSIDTVPDDLKISINVDYTNQGARDLIGNIAGHVHHEGISSENNFKVCTVTCDLNGQASRVGTANSMGFNVVTILPNERKVKLSGFGHAVDQNFVY
jgi:hypothetical protein